MADVNGIALLYRALNGYSIELHRHLRHLTLYIFDPDRFAITRLYTYKIEACS